MGIDLFPWHHYHLVTEGEKSVSLKAYSQARTNTKRSFCFGCSAESWRENRRMVVLWPQATWCRLFVLKRQKKPLSFGIIRSCFLSFLFPPHQNVQRTSFTAHKKSIQTVSKSFMECNKSEDKSTSFYFKMSVALIENLSSWFSKLSFHLLKVTFAFITCNFLDRYFSAAGTQHEKCISF